MPIGDAVGEVAGGALKLIAKFFYEIILDFFVRGLGYVLCRPFSKTIDPDGFLVFFIGMIAWIGFLAVIYFLFGYKFFS